MAGLERRWLAFWQRAGAAGSPLPAWKIIAQRYSEPHRAYHVLDHVAHCLDELDAARDLAHDPLAVELALWFHDAVYDTHATDNEARSAVLAATTARSMGLSEATIATTTRLILATRHDALPADGDEALVVDIDLAILGQPPEAFDEYERRIRREYAWVPQLLFDTKRADILRSFLDRPVLFTTPFFHARYEAAARENLRRSLGGGAPGST